MGEDELWWWCCVLEGDAHVIEFEGEWKADEEAEEEEPSGVEDKMP